MSIYPECTLPLIVSSKVKCKKQNIDGYEHEIWNYDSNYICFDENESIKNCRSVIFAYPQHHLLSICPGKTTDPTTFCEKHHCFDNIYVNEYIDGTMVHLFYDKRRNMWEISSKNHISGSQKLQKGVSKTATPLLTMFKEALGYNSEDSLQEITSLKYFPKNYCYQFVLLHPDNTILYPITYSMIYMVAVYDITPNSHRALNIPQCIYEQWDFLQNTRILFPKQKKINNWEDISKHQLSIFHDSKNISGYMALHVESGERAKFMNPEYIQAKELNKCSPRLGLYYLCLHKKNLVKDYLCYFPQFRRTFRKFQELFQDYIEELHAAYLVKYVWKNSTSGRMNEKYFPYVNDIHRELYIPSLRTSRIRVTKSLVYQYMMKKPPGELLYILCECRRNCGVNII